MVLFPRDLAFSPDPDEVCGTPEESRAIAPFRHGVKNQDWYFTKYWPHGAHCNEDIVNNGANNGGSTSSSESSAANDNNEDDESNYSVEEGEGDDVTRTSIGSFSGADGRGGGD